MGLFKGSDAKTADQAVVDQASATLERGDKIFVGRLVGGLREDSADGWARTIGAVEALGWRLDQWSVSEHIGWAIFRR